LRYGSKLRVITRLANKLVSLEVDYWSSLFAIRINMVSIQDMPKTTF
jgi:hypothetical protein